MNPLSSDVLEALAYMGDVPIDLPPLPSDYCAKTIDVLFEGIPVYCWVEGDITLHLNLSEDLQPRSIELAFDDAPVLVLVGDEVVINRLENLSLEDIVGAPNMEDLTCQ
jgi:hypothetical protein